MGGGVRLHVTGAAGAGVEALGKALAGELRLKFLDTDDYYWLPTDPPFTEKRTIPERLRLLGRDFSRHAGGWILAGPMPGWGDPLIPHFSHVIVVDTPEDVRKARLREREIARYGGAKRPGIDLVHTSNEHCVWAAGYDTGERSGRSCNGLEGWLARLPCPVLTVDGREDSAALAEAIMRQLLTEAA